MDVIFINGMPGTGKTTMAEILVALSPIVRGGQEFNFEHMSIGNTLRAMAIGREILEDEKELSRSIQPYADLIMEAKPIPHSLVFDIVSYRLITQPRDRSLIIDGFPRFIEQIAGLEKIIQNAGITNVVQFVMQADNDVVKDRIISRGTRPGEKHINENFLDFRLSEYQINVSPALNKLAELDMVITHRIDASSTKEESLKQILTSL